MFIQLLFHALEFVANPMKSLFAQNDHLKIITGEITHHLQKSSLSVLDSTERCKILSKQPAIKKVHGITSELHFLKVYFEYFCLMFKNC